MKITLDYKKIIAEAWLFTQQNKKLILWFAYVPAIIGSIIGIFYLAYQILSFRSSHLFLNESKSFLSQLAEIIKNIFSSFPTLGIILTILTIVILLIYFFVPTYLEGCIIQFIARSYNGQEVSLAATLGYGYKSYLALIEFHAIAKSFSFLSILTEAAFVMRNFNADTFKLLIIPLVIIFFFGLIITLLLTYTDYFIVIDRSGVFQSITKSFNLVITNWQHTFLLTILMLIISLRILINIVIILAIPTIFTISATIIASFSMAKIGIIVGLIFGLGALLVASYFNAVIHIFADTVWTISFLKLTKKEEVDARTVIAKETN